jgi:SAM-dependent methyltransferase
MMFVGDGNFRAIGEEFLRYFTELGKLKPNEDILDVGCGIGRMAVPLTRFLDKDGSYEGFDIVKTGTDWCNNNISRKFPNFRFQHADILNRAYNPKGKLDAAKWRFPYQSGTFDFVFLTSVFTHMLPEAMENYFSEISRVLRRDGRSLITFFLLNAESVELIDQRKSTLDFKYDFGGYRVIDKDVPESAVAYAEHYVRSLYQKHDMMIIEPIYYGSWCGRQDFLSYQDIIVATRT